MKNDNGIAIVDKLEKLRPSVNYNLGTEISVTIGRLGEDGKPRNFSLDYETPKTSNGGCFARVYATEFGEGTQANLFSWYGPALSYPDLRQYQHGLRAMERVAKRMDAMYSERGGSADAADSFGRWLEACGVTKVYCRPESSVKESWLSKGEWQVLTVGEFVNRVRVNLYCNPPKAQETECAR